MFCGVLDSPKPALLSDCPSSCDSNQMQSSLLGVIMSLLGWLLWGVAVGYAIAAEKKLRLRGELLEQQGTLAAGQARVIERAMWHLWMVRNACEGTHLDATKGDCLRFALAAMLCDDWAVLHRDLHRVATDPEESETVRKSAALTLSELQLPVTPWSNSVPEGRPLWNAHALRCAYREAMSGWGDLVPGMRFVPNSVAPADLPQR